MLKYAITHFALCLYFATFSMANNEKETQNDLLKTVAILKKRGKHAQKVRSPKEDKLRIKAKHKREKIKEEKIKKQLIQEIKQKYPSAPTPNDIEELKRLHKILFSKDIKKTFRREKKK